eukprot:Opistho-2@578
MMEWFHSLRDSVTQNVSSVPADAWIASLVATILFYVVIAWTLRYILRVIFSPILAFIFLSWGALSLGNVTGAWIARNHQHIIADPLYATLSKYGFRVEVTATSVLLLANVMAVWCGVIKIAESLKRRPRSS